MKKEFRQSESEILSPLLFSIYLNDLQDFLEGLNIKGIDSISRDIENELMVYFKILILLYADDTILLSESKDDLQIMLSEFSTYCKKWKFRKLRFKFFQKEEFQTI